MQREFEYEGTAMGTDYSIAIVSDSRELADANAARATAMIHAYDARFSRFLPESELSLLNTKKQAAVSETFFDAAKEAYALFRLTHGVFNPLVQISRFGYNKTFAELDGRNMTEDATPYNIDFSTTVLDAKKQKIKLRQGQKLDFGGFLKGYLATLLCRDIMASSPNITGAIVNIGGDIHTEGLDEHGRMFLFEVFNPVSGEHLPVSVHNMSLATSGTYKRSWTAGDVRVHHILNKEGTGNPDTDIVSATVIHPRGSKAEAYAKVFLSVGPDKAKAIIPDRGVRYLIIRENGAIHSNI